MSFSFIKKGSSRGVVMGVQDVAERINDEGAPRSGDFCWPFLFGTVAGEIPGCGPFRCA